MTATVAMQALYNFSEISTGKQWPPKRRQPLNRTWALYNQWYSGNFEHFLQQNQTPRITTNMFALVANFWRDTVVPEKIDISVPNTRVQDMIDALHDNLLLATRSVVTHMAVYGVGVYDNTRYLDPRAINPMYWFPVRSPWDYNESLGDIIAYPFIESANYSPDRLRVGKYQNGRGVENNYRLDGFMVTAALRRRETRPVPTLPCISVSLNNSLYGQSAFPIITTQVQELHRLESFVSASMERHSDPHLAMAESSIQRDDQDRPVVDTRGMVIPIQDNEPEPKYVQYELDFEAMEIAIVRMRANIYLLSSIMPSLLESQENTNNIPMSGAALARLAVPTTVKVRAHWEVLEDAIKDVIMGQIEHAQAGPEVLPMIDKDDIKVDFGEPLYIIQEDANDPTTDGREAEPVAL